MKCVLLIYQGSAPLPETDRWKALSEAEQKAIYADYAKLNEVAGIAPGHPLGLPDAARTVRVRDGKIEVEKGTYLAEGVAGILRLRGRQHGGCDCAGGSHPGGSAGRRDRDPAGREILVIGW